MSSASIDDRNSQHNIVAFGGNVMLTRLFLSSGLPLYAHKIITHAK